jgi:hypothetical protein
MAVSDYAGLIDAVAAKYGVDPNLIGKVMFAESRGRPGLTSPKGAGGLMQIMPPLAAHYGEDPSDPAQNIDMGARYLSEMLRRYNGDVPKALAAYNAGPGRVDKYGANVPIPETQNYLAQILGAAPMQTGTPSAFGSPGGLSAQALDMMRQGQEALKEQRGLTEQEVKGNEDFSKHYADP